MKTQLLPVSSPEALSSALEILRRGELIAFPTDTVYGLAADLFNPAAIQRIFDVKGRDNTKAIPVLLGSLEQLRQVTLDLPDEAVRLAARFWPGALTLVVHRQPALPEVLSPTPTVGVRMPSHPFALALLARSGPLAVTSANMSGAANPLNASDVLAQLGGRIALVLDGGPVSGGVPSCVVDCTQTPPAILRQGAISENDILKCLAAG